MKIIIGLGNPGSEYDNTRHNAGFMMVDRFKEKNGFSDFQFNKKFNCEIASAQEDDKLVIAKPQTFMNNSGEAVRSLLDFYKLSPDDIIVVHDDLDIELGKYKVATDSSSAGHHGVQDVFDKLGTQKICRIRVGVGQVKDGALVCRLDASDYVLQKMSPEELNIMDSLTENILKEIDDWTKKTP